MSAHTMKLKTLFRPALCSLLGIVSISFAAPALADPLLEEIVEFTGDVLFLQHKVPGLVIGALRDGEIAVHGVGERSKGRNAPDGDTVLRIGSITKAFTGQVLASLAATHSAGLPREVPHEQGPPDDPFKPITRAAFADWLGNESLLYAPGTGILYSNFAFDLLAIGLSEAAKKPYDELLKERITGPLGMSDTTFVLDFSQKRRLMQGHGVRGAGIPDVPTGDVIVGSGGLYSTPNDLLRWMQWHLERLSDKDAETRMLDHAAYLVRDGLRPVQGMDESGHMDAMSLGWVVMMPEGNRPLILQKAGGLQGTFTYIAFAPTRGVAVFVAINEFNFGAAMAMAEAANEMIATLAPR